jgi:hypothetical protein
MTMKKLVVSVAGALLLLTAAPIIGRATAPASSMQQQSEQQSKTFSGTITKHGDNFILNDAANKTSYMLDDAQKASRYEGKKAKVAGTVDVASNTIHVETIEEGAYLAAKPAVHGGVHCFRPLQMLPFDFKILGLPGKYAFEEMRIASQFCL